MARITVHIDSETASLVRKAARAAGGSQSRWLADLIRHRTTREWPESVRRLAGAWAEVPSVEDLRRGAARDVRREPV